MPTKKTWSSEQLQLLSKAYSESCSKRWKHVAKIFSEAGFSRSELECRDKWINSVDPTIDRSDWKHQELQALYRIYEKIGTRWSKIQTELGRTQNKIKNRFYGTLRNYVRFVLNKFDHQKSYNHLISKLSPRFLNNLYAGQKDLSFLRGEVKHTIRKMNYHVDKEILSQRIDEHYKLYELLAYRVKMQFNEHPESINEFETRKLNYEKTLLENKETINPINRPQDHQKTTDKTNQSPMEAVVARTQFLAQDNHYPLALSQSNDLGICFPFVMNPNSWGYIFFIDRV